MNHPVRSRPLAAHRHVPGCRAIASPAIRRPDAAGPGTIAIHRPAEVREAVVITLPASPRAAAADRPRGPCRF